MRVISILMLLGWCFSARSQHDKGSPNFREVFVLMENRFDLFKGELKQVRQGDSIFYSQVEIEKSRENEIVKSEAGSYIYYAQLGHRLTLEQAKKVVNEWNQQVRMMADGFSSKNQKMTLTRGIYTGYQYKKAEKGRWYIVDIFYYKLENSDRYAAGLQLTTN